MKNNENAKLLSEALRYCGFRNASEETANEYLPILERAKATGSFRHVLRCMDVEVDEEGVRLMPDGIVLKGSLAKRMLSECDQALVIGATLGIGFDRALKKEQLLNMHDALFFDAAGSALIEQQLDELEETLAEQYSPLFLTDRFSCGYGDLPLQVQKDLADALDLSKTAGIFVHDSLMMTPSKSVTALIGLSKTKQPARIRGCAYCSLKGQCAYRKGGTICGF